MQKNRILSCLVLSLFIMNIIFTAGVSPVYAGATLSDIQGHWAQRQIEKLVEHGIISGYSDGEFKSEKEVSRAEFITLINRAFKYSASKEINYIDVSPADWYYKEIAISAAAGYISGYETEKGTMMKPNKPISRQEVAVIIERILKMDLSTAGQAVDRLNDANQIADWSRNAVGALLSGGYLNGYPDNTFKANKSMSRAEAVVIIDRVMGDALKVSDIEANPPSGEVKANTKVELKTDTPGATIYYTSNGDIPNQKSTKYKKEITIKKAVKIKAIAIKKGMTDSEILVAEYTIRRSGGGGGGGSTEPTIITTLPAGNYKGDFKLNNLSNNTTLGPVTGSAKITGTLYLEPGETYELTLQNIQVDNIEIVCGKKEKLSFINVVSDEIKIEDEDGISVYKYFEHEMPQDK